jgi:sugar phosphate isomerase/epimerase
MEKHGIRFGIEFVAPKTFRKDHKYEFIHRLDQALELCEAIGTSNMGILLDSWHWYTSHGTVEELQSLTDEQIVGVHINDAPEGLAIDEQVDNVRCLPGETGVIDLRAFLGTLQNTGYSGPVTVEPFSKSVSEMEPEAAARATSEALLKVWRQAGV